MVVLYTLIIVLSGYLVLSNLHHVRPSARKGKATMFDVRHLLMEGEKELAVQLYCEIFNTMPAKAKKDIEELERSLKV